MMYLQKNKSWAFGISLNKAVFCEGLYKEYEFRIDFYKWSFGIVW